MVPVKSSRRALRQVAGEAGEVAVGDEGGERLAGLAGHLLVDPLEPLHQAADVVVAVAVLPDVLDDLVRSSASGRSGGSAVIAGRLAEVLEQRAVEAVEDGEVRLVGVPLALARAAAEHLLEEDAGLHRPQEDDELEVGDVDAGGQQVDGDDDASAWGGCGTRGSAAAGGRRGR